MKQCPKCQRWLDNVSMTCDCGYEFPARHRKQCPECGKTLPDDFTRCRDCGYQFFPVRRISHDTSAREQNPLFLILAAVSSLILWGLTIISFLFSVWWVCSVLSNLGESESPLASLALAVAGLLLGVVSLYPPKATGGFADWNISTKERTKVARVIEVEILWVCFAGLIYVLTPVFSGD